MPSLEAYPDLLTTEDVAAILRKSPQVVRRMFSTGDLPAVHIGARWYLPKARLVELVEGRRGCSPCDRVAPASEAGHDGRAPAHLSMRER